MHDFCIDFEWATKSKDFARFVAHTKGNSIGIDSAMPVERVGVISSKSSLFQGSPGVLRYNRLEIHSSGAEKVGCAADGIGICVKFFRLLKHATP